MTLWFWAWVCNFSVFQENDLLIQWFSMGDNSVTFLVVTTGWGCYWPLVGRGQGCCETSHNAQDPPAASNKELCGPKCHAAGVEKTCLTPIDKILRNPSIFSMWKAYTWQSHFKYFCYFIPYFQRTLCFFYYIFIKNFPRWGFFCCSHGRI